MTNAPTPLIAVDIGNSAIKVGVFEGRMDGPLPRPEHVRSLRRKERFSELDPLLPGAACRWRVGSVHRGAEERLAAWVRAQRPQDDYRQLHCVDLPLNIEVEAPERVGADRLLAAVAANRLRRPERAAIVVDAGSAITIDLVSAAGAFRGGVILPGARMIAHTLAEKTDLLPEVIFHPTEPPPPVVGASTSAAIRSGLFWGAVGAVREVIERISDQLDSPPQVFIAGGDAQPLAPHLKLESQAVPHLVLCGIALASG